MQTFWEVQLWQFAEQTPVYSELTSELNPEADAVAIQLAGFAPLTEREFWDGD